jgi:predicted transcriptional regulator
MSKMTEVTLQLPDEVMARLRDEAERLNKPLESVIGTAILYFLDDEPTEEEILAGLRTGMQQALAGDYRPAREVLDEIDREVSDDGDAG